MSTNMMIIIGVAVLVPLIAVILAANGSRPRITQIDRTVTHDDPEKDDDA